MNSKEMLISNARKAMLDNITALDKKTLQQELESHLKLEFAYKDETERLNNIIDELEKWLEEKQALYGINQQRFSWGVCGEALDKLKALKEGKNE